MSVVEEIQVKGFVHPTTGIITRNAAAETLFDINVDGPLQYLRIQNQGTTKVFVCLNDTASAAVYNEILLACVGAADGSGGVFEVQMGWKVTKVSVFGSGAYSVSMTKVTNKSNVRE